MYASHCLYICSPPLHARVPHIISAFPSVYAVPRCTTGLYSSRYCHHRRTLPLHCGTVIPARPCPSWYRHPHGRPLSFNDMTSTPRLHSIFVVALQSAQLTVHPATASSAPSNLSLPGLVQPLPSALYRHCSVLSALHHCRPCCPHRISPTGLPQPWFSTPAPQSQLLLAIPHCIFTATID